MAGKHWMILGALLVSLGTTVSGIEHYEELYSPQIVGGLLMQIGTTIGALLVGSPLSRTVWTPEQRADKAQPSTPGTFGR